ncbi:hypothetical protein Y696_00460 [Mesotoga sp. H07pep.5.4]|nr:BREX-3 system phosphatase PglZ [Mesotoga sp. H07pep.5.4]RLL82604.1 hypothetical protein Y696_00460 [Mesotoga sp. H07pep.5.4]
MRSLNSRIIDKILNPEKDSMIVYDPDGLVDQAVLEELSERGFHVIEYKDPIAFRFEYESEFRDKAKSFLVLTRETPAGELPFDIYSSLLTVDVSLSSIFPKLSRTALESLERWELDRLNDSYSDDLDYLSTRRTREFILKRIYEFDPSKRYNLTELIAWLIKLHYNRLQLRGELFDLVMDIARERGYERLLDLPSFVEHRESFLEFLQERWPVFLKRHGRFSVSDNNEASFRQKGPNSLPFDDPSIKVYTDTMFAEGLLKPVPVDDPSKFEKSWMVIGIDGPGSERIRFKKLLQIVSDSLPKANTSYNNWIDFAWRWAELNLVACSIPLGNDDQSDLNAIRTITDSQFESWMVEEYGRLLTVSSRWPVTVRDIFNWTSKLSIENKKLALIVIDGMSLLQWLKLSNCMKDFSFEQYAAYAMIPTITAVSRQAIFSGMLPMDLPNLTSNSAESRLWERAWLDRGFREREIAHINKPDNQLIREVEQSIGKGQSLIGIVIRELDEKAHGENIGMRALLAATETWAKESCFLDLCKLLYREGYEVFLTSDHGNVEANGIGNPSEGLIAETRGERVRIYKDRLLREKIHIEYPDSIEWVPVGLPQNFFPLIAQGRRAFTTANSVVVSHGGLTLEEVIVPLIRLRKG